MAGQIIPYDGDGVLSKEDVALLTRKMWKDIRQWTFIAIFVAGIGVITGFPMTPVVWEIGGGILLLILIGHLLRTRYLLKRSSKKILLGTIDQRYKSTGNGDEGTGYFFSINGKQLAVPEPIYKQYFTRDIAEFHYIDELILRHRLLKRGEKEYTA
jgi:hypothetical protein